MRPERYIGFTENSTLNSVAEVYFNVKCNPQVAWT
jgi:hypothetical protein